METSELRWSKTDPSSCRQDLEAGHRPVHQVCIKLTSYIILVWGILIYSQTGTTFKHSFWKAICTKENYECTLVCWN